jgi:alpha-glucosidase
MKLRAQPDWWRGATIYQIYPRSFSDSNGDGIGDLNGITAHLDYVASLGVDGIWLSPFFTSPMRDFGYDVSDYCSVDPIFGTLADFDALVARAHALNLKVIIDQVWSHTAIEHAWFEESRQSRDNRKADWYTWVDAQPDGGIPNNWQSWMGHGTWTWDTRRQQYYLHNFLPQMPDLNFHCREVQDAILDVGRFWLERGVDGFRLDTANYYCHNRTLADNPPQPPEKRGNIPAAMQIHLHNICQPETVTFMERVRSLLDQFGDRMAVAEIGSANSLERMIEYTRGTNRLHTAYSFLLLGDQPTPKRLVELNDPWQSGEGATAWPSWAMSNHDVQRVATRWSNNDAQRARQLLVLLACMRGTLFIYQGEELGLTESDVPFEYIQDPFGKAHWPRHKGRDGCRTPFPWQANALHGGFTRGSPWLPADAANLARAVDIQEADEGSTLHLLRELMALRKAHPALRLGSLQGVQADDKVMVLLRETPDDAVLCAFNLNAELATVTLPGTFSSSSTLMKVGTVVQQPGSLAMQPWSAIFLSPSP